MGYHNHQVLLDCRHAPLLGLEEAGHLVEDTLAQSGVVNRQHKEGGGLALSQRHHQGVRDIALLHVLDAAEAGTELCNILPGARTDDGLLLSLGKTDAGRSHGVRVMLCDRASRGGHVV